MKTYIGTKVIKAEPMRLMAAERVLNRKIKDGDADGYLVAYEDGYRSWSPRLVFEKAYRHTNGMTFGLAIEALKMGKKACRKGWNGKGIFIELQRPDEHSKMTSPYIFINTTGLQTNNPDAPKSCVPWLASQTDMLADDWEIFE
ncbi:DUF2829 domain-containing protein [Pectinatus frisingensis]|uniref:DUF2829 domain-containing protein n=1 Tax=Pectinatus frisingensis TaxID=865 RepID=UPI003D80217B